MDSEQKSIRRSVIVLILTATALFFALALGFVLMRARIPQQIGASAERAARREHIINQKNPLALQISAAEPEPLRINRTCLGRQLMLSERGLLFRQQIAPRRNIQRFRNRSAEIFRMCVALRAAAASGNRYPCHK